MITRYPAVAGSFYPGNPGKLHHDVEQMLDEAKIPQLSPKALIAPHAGYIYSGPIAATAYNALKGIARNITRVLLLGPSHTVALRGMAIPECDQFQTPLGVVPIDAEAIDKIAHLTSTCRNDQAHAQEHSLEVHLPFLQTVLGDFHLVPIVVGETPPKLVAEVLNLLWGGDETLIIVSSDLSHYHSYESAKILDQSTTHEFERLSSNIRGEQACGCYPVNGLLLAAKQHDLKLTTLDLRNSGDTAGDHGRVVGYGAYALH